MKYLFLIVAVVLMIGCSENPIGPSISEQSKNDSLAVIVDSLLNNINVGQDIFDKKDTVQLNIELLDSLNKAFDVFKKEE